MKNIVCIRELNFSERNSSKNNRCCFKAITIFFPICQETKIVSFFAILGTRPPPPDIPMKSGEVSNIATKTTVQQSSASGSFTVIGETTIYGQAANDASDQGKSTV